MSTPNAPGPGWYTDPAMAGMLRWWDGQRWTVAQQPAQQPLRPLPVPRYRPAIPPYTGRNERLGQIAIVSRAVLLILNAALYAQVLDDLVRGYIKLMTATHPEQTPLIDIRGALLLAASGLLGLAPI